MTDAYLHPLLSACLTKAGLVLGEGGWSGVTQAQIELARGLPRMRELLAKLPDGTLASIGSTSAEPINKFLADHGMNIRIPQLNQGDIAVAAVLDILAMWTSPGTATKFYAGDHYPAVVMKASNFSVAVSQSGQEIYKPKTDGPIDIAFVVAPTLSMGMACLRETSRDSTDSFRSLTFPMIDLSEEADIGWVLGMRWGDIVIRHAAAQVKVRMNHLGAHMKAGAAMVATRSASLGRDVVIDQPFVLAAMLDGEVVLAVHLPKTTWREPPNLGETKGDGPKVW